MAVILGHRGCRGPIENTLPAFQSAIEQGADGIELDVHVSSDGQLIVIHDDRLEGTTSGEGYIHEHTLEEIKAHTVDGVHEVPTLAEVCALIAKLQKETGRKLTINVELKADDAVEGVVATIHECHKQGLLEPSNFLVSSFNHTLLKHVKDLDSTIRIGHLLDETPEKFALKKLVDEQHPYSLHVELNHCDEELAARARKRGLKIFIWYLDEQPPNSQIEKVLALVKLQVAGFITSYPKEMNDIIQGGTSQKDAINRLKQNGNGSSEHKLNHLLESRKKSWSGGKKE